MNGISGTGYTMDDVRAMRVWDMMQGERNGVGGPYALDSLALVLDGVERSVPKDLDLLRYPFTRDAHVRNTVSTIWAYRVKQTLVGIPIFHTRFSFELYFRPETALQELRALHVYDYLSSHVVRSGTVDAELLNKTLLWQQMTNTAHEADRPYDCLSQQSQMAIRQASDHVSSPQYLLPSQYHLTQFSAAMAAGALAAMPMVRGIR